ncbi:MAG: hypothetical protein ACOYBT_09905 [Polynucleobacter sp.]
MPSASEFSTTPASNTTIGGVNAGEGCSPAGLNNIARYLAATARDLWDRLPDITTLMPKTGGTFTGDILRQSRGAYLHHANSAQTNGQVFFLPEGSARPTAAEGTLVFFYS